MTSVVWLRADEQPPSPCAFVDLNKPWGIGIMSMMAHGSGATFYVTAPYGVEERDAAITDACCWASARGLTVYVSNAAQLNQSRP